MPHTPASPTPDVSHARAQADRRAFRIKLSGSVLALIRLPNHRQIRAKLHQLSASGGLLHIQTPLDENVVVELIFCIGSVTIRENAEILFPMWATQGWLQPFRFKDMDEARRNILETSLHTLGDQVESADSGTAPRENFRPQ